MASKAKGSTPAGVTCVKVKPDGRKADFFIARHEPTRAQFTGETAEEATRKLTEFLAQQ